MAPISEVQAKYARNPRHFITEGSTLCIHVFLLDFQEKIIGYRWIFNYALLCPDVKCSCDRQISGSLSTFYQARSDLNVYHSVR